MGPRSQPEFAEIPYGYTMRSHSLNPFLAGYPKFRDWIGALSNLYAFLYRDTMRVLTFGEPLARYTIVFVSDGSPTYNQDDELLCGDVVARLRGLSSREVFLLPKKNLKISPFLLTDRQSCPLLFCSPWSPSVSPKQWCGSLRWRDCNTEELSMKSHMRACG